MFFAIHLYNFDDPVNFAYKNPAICVPTIALQLANQQIQEIVDWKSAFLANYSTPLKAIFGFTDAQLSDYNTIFGIVDTFVSDYYNNNSIPLLENQGINLTQFNESVFGFEYNEIIYHFNGDANGLVARATMASIIPELIMWMDNRVNTDTAASIVYPEYRGYAYPRLVLLSAHDGTLGSHQTYLKRCMPSQNINLYYTPFASAIYYELHRADGKSTYSINDYYVVITYNDNPMVNISYVNFKAAVTDPGNLMTIPQLATFCQFPVPSTITNYTDQNITINITNTAQVVGTLGKGYDGYFYSTVVLACFDFTLLIAVIIYCLCCASKSAAVGGTEMRVVNVQSKA